MRIILNIKKNNKQEELLSIHSAFRTLQYCTTVKLREYLQENHNAIWTNTGNTYRSDEKRIRRSLDKLVDFGLATKDKKGKEYHYAYIQDNTNTQDSINNLAKEIDMRIIENKSYYQKRVSILSRLNNISNVYYIDIEQEDITKKEAIIKDLERAIESNYYVEITYNHKKYKTIPLRIVLFDGYWYLIAYSNEKYYKYRIKSIPFITLINEKHKVDIKLDFTEWHNIMHDPNITPTKIKLFIKDTVFHYFQEKNILKVNTYNTRLTPCNDGWEYELYITHEWELLPTLMRWQKYITILEQEGTIDIKKIHHTILEEAQKKLDISDYI